MTVGILEYKDDKFIQDVISRLDLPNQFVSLKNESLDFRPEFKVILDRLSFQDRFLKEVMKAYSMKGCYIINNPFSAESMNKIIGTEICQRLGIPHPKTIILPMVDEDWEPNEGVALPDWGQIFSEIKFPVVLKPYDGYAWDNVFFVNSQEELKDLWKAMKSSHLMLIEEKIKYVHYYRTFCISKRDILFVKWIPKDRAMGQCLWSDLSEIAHVRGQLEDWTRKLNQILDFDINVVEWAITEEGKPVLIEAFNEVPDINSWSMPGDYYDWIVNKFVECVKDKYTSNERNRVIFL